MVRFTAKGVGVFAAAMAATALTPVVAHAEPVSTMIGLSALIFNAFGGFVAVGTAASIGGAIVGGAISIGLSFASAALSHRGVGALTSDTQKSGINTSEQRLSTRQSTPPKRIVYGSTFCGGALFFEQVKPPYLYRGYLISDRKINGVTGLYIGNNRVPFSAFTPNTILTPIGQDGLPDYPNRLRVSVRLGDDDQAIDPLLAADFPSLASTFRQRGIATVVVRYHYGSSDDEHRELWGASGQANTLFLVDGVSVHDPRDPTQDRDDESTWSFQNNATLCQTDYLRQSYGGRIDASKIDWDKTAEAADFDDEAVPCNDGTAIKRYTLDGLLLLNQKPYSVLKSMLSANRATVANGGGKVWISSAKPKQPSLCIYDNLLAGALSFRNEKLKRDQINILQTRFVADEREYNLADGPILRREDLITADGEELTGTIDLPWTRDYRRVQRLQKAFLESSRLGKAITAPIDIVALAEAERELINESAVVDSELFSPANATTTINSLAIVGDFTALQVEMSEYDPLIETAWTPSVDESAFTVANLDVS